MKLPRYYLSLLALAICFLSLSAQNAINPNLLNVAEIDFEKYKPGQEFTKADWNNGNGVTVPYVNGVAQHRVFIDDAVSHSGNKSLRVLYPSDGVGPPQSGAQAPLKVPPASEYYVSYWFRFSENFSWGSKNFAGKLPGLSSGKGCSGCEICDGMNGFSARLMWVRNGKLVLYLYHMDKVSRCGDNYDLLGNDKKPYYAKRGEWINVVERIKINTESNHDGEAQVWLNGTEAINLTGLKFVTNGDLVDTFAISTFFGGDHAGYAPGVDCHIWFDDIVISVDKTKVKF